ncbi:hypothetical protein OUZ56_025076 [Daphnia magna]|uniref:Uncharacterized protein n=1 Tax=Daphnia magna TaxID=35525 RepID=A0ABQ9ZJS9_9CRUS|nr:hypothetical protein OUZ56_025076 [Daphnia magna]
MTFLFDMDRAKKERSLKIILMDTLHIEDIPSFAFWHGQERADAMGHAGHAQLATSWRDKIKQTIIRHVPYDECQL